MKSLSSLPPQLLSNYYRNQSEEVKANYRIAVGLKALSFEMSQLSDNQVVTKTRKESTSY